MKAQLMRISVGIVGLGALLYFLACSPTAPNNNSNQNQSLSANQNKAESNTAALDLSPCDDYGSGHGQHAKEIRDKIIAKMGTKLKKQLKDPDHPKGTFTVEVQKAPDGKYYVGYIKGKIGGDDELKQLSDILNDFQSKQDCLRVIFFLPTQTSLTTDGGPGFEWNSCEFPMVVCPNGECCMPTVDPGPQSTPSPTNTNANANRP